MSNPSNPVPGFGNEGLGQQYTGLTHGGPGQRPAGIASSHPEASAHGSMGATPADPGLTTDHPRHPGDDRSIGEIVGDLFADFSTLMRQEVALAKAEISESAKSAGKGAGLFGSAGVAAHMALLFLSLALWWMIAHLLGDIPKYGWSFLVVAILWAIAAAVMAKIGKSELEDVQGVPKTQQTLQQIPDALKGNEENNR